MKRGKELRRKDRRENELSEEEEGEKEMVFEESKRRMD